MLESGLVGLILSDQTIQSLIGKRIYALILPENTLLPAITYQVISGSEQTSFETAVLSMRRFQCDIWAGNSAGSQSTYTNAKMVERSLFRVLHGFSGILPGDDGTRVLHCFRRMAIDRFESQSRFYRVLNEYTITYVE